MARKQTLKVYRTPIGFHDAYVAAPSQKAALAAWGSDANLFARGMAELVTDDELAPEALANPGKVVRKLRGTAEEQIAALPPSVPITHNGRGKDHAKTAPSSRSSHAKRTVQAAPRAPRPDRSHLDAAQKALDDADAQFENARVQWAERQAELDRERRSLEYEHDRKQAALQRGLDRAKEAYEKAITRWRG